MLEAAVSLCFCHYGLAVARQASQYDMDICGLSTSCVAGLCHKGECICDPGWSGARCDTQRCSSDCSGRGACLNGTCACKYGSQGSECNLGVCPRSCSGHGRCTAQGCVCNKGFLGK
mmetsp:Transcript_21183/g.55798  ORF Transcript_21183/g.55798 Transcript_21183/m.55798 type:complete len:117 (-) Transcript_21183:3010-3360(-)